MVFIANIEAIFISTGQQEERALDGYDSNRQPVYDPTVPVAYDASGKPVTLYGYDSNNYPVYDPQTPLAYDTNGNPINLRTDIVADPADDNGTVASSQEHHQHSTTSQIKRKSSQDQDTAGTRNSANDGDGSRTANTGVAESGRSDDSQGSLFDDEEAFHNLGGSRNENTNLKDVIGKAGERVSLATAMADKERYWVEPDSLEIWDLNYRKTLFPGT